MKLKLLDVIVTFQGLSNCETVKDPATRWSIVKNRRLMTPVIDHYEAERVKLIQKHTPTGESQTGPNGFTAEITTLLQIEEDIPGLVMLDKEMMINGGVSIETLEKIFPLIRE